MRQRPSDPQIDRTSSARRALPGGLAVLLLLFMSCAAALTPEEAAGLLQKADDLKTSNYGEFATIVKRLDESQDLSPSQHQYLRYLQGWQSAYTGDYKSAISTLESVIDRSRNVTLRFRAGVTAANVAVLASQYEDAFSQLSQLLTLLPEVPDGDARAQGMAVAAYLYNQVGEYDLALSYADRLLQENPTGRGACAGRQLKLEALYKSGRLQAIGPEFQAGFDACTKAGESLPANAIRTYAARLHIDHGRYDEAIELLNAHYGEVQQTHYPRAISEYDSLLAQAYHDKGDAKRARQFAMRAIEASVKDQYTEPLVTANRVLYELARQQGDSRSALTFHERYAAADKGYLDDVSARQLAYERVNHETLAKQLQIDALNRQNEVLQLQRALDRKAAETSRLYITLLLMVLAFIAFFAYRIKRSQLHFMRLSRLDGLTGIANRPHFIEQAERALESSRKTQQEVCIVLCDLDHFKSINDKYGHATGDFVLRQAVTACRSHLRAGDLFGRFGGEEFGFLLPGCSPVDAARRAEQLRIAILGVAAHHGSLVTTVSASFGVAGNGSSGYELRQLLAHADAALYKAKHAGRNCVVMYETTGDVEGPGPFAGLAPSAGHVPAMPDEPARGVGRG